MIFNTKDSNCPLLLLAEFNVLKEKFNHVELKGHKKTLSSQQNKALHLLFTQVANELNGIGIPFVYRGLKGMELETAWTGVLFKEMTWRPLQKAMFGIDSTTKINTAQINAVFDAINKFFAERGIEVSFPNEFDYYLKFYEKQNK